jgi:hypothetical protein
MTHIWSPQGVPFSANWKNLYQCAILEVNPTKLQQRIVEARHAILDRAEEIDTKTAGEESHSLNDALRTLRFLEETSATEYPAA